VNKGNVINLSNPVISQWTNSWHGLEAVTVLNNVLLGVAVLFLSRILGMLYFVNNINNVDIETRIRKGLLKEGVIFLIFFLGFLVRTLLSFGFAVNPSSGEVMIQPYKYLYNFMQMPIVTVVFLIGVVGVLWGLIGTIYSNTFKKGIWFSGAGTVLTVFALLLCVGYNNTPYYPSRMDLESSLTLANSCSSQFTLTVMSWVSILVPFVLAYIFYVWRKLDSTKIDATEISDKGNDSY